MRNPSKCINFRIGSEMANFKSFFTCVVFTGGKCGFNQKGPHANYYGFSARMTCMAVVIAEVIALNFIKVFK